MPTMPTLLCDFHDDIDSTEKFIDIYERANAHERNSLFAALALNWANNISVLHFDHLIRCLEPARIVTFHRTVTTKNPLFLKEVAHIKNDAFNKEAQATREKIYRLFLNDKERLDNAFRAMLFLILDNYPGNQIEKLKGIIETTFSDPLITDLTALLEKTESAMRFVEFNITSTRLRNAITQLISNLRTEEKIIEVERIIQLAKSKDPITETPTQWNPFSLFAERDSAPPAASSFFAATHHRPEL